VTYAKVSKEDIFKAANGNGSVHKISINNGVSKQRSYFQTDSWELNFTWN
jgi:hypothetical protein